MSALPADRATGTDERAARSNAGEKLTVPHDGYSGDEHMTDADARDAWRLVRRAVSNRARVEYNHVRIGAFLQPPFSPRSGSGPFQPLRRHQRHLAQRI